MSDMQVVIEADKWKSFWVWLWAAGSAFCFIAYWIGFFALDLFVVSKK